MLYCRNILRKNKIKIILCLILLWGTFLRVYSLGKESLHIQEILDVGYAAEPIAKTVQLSVSVGHFPTTFIMMHYWIKLFGKSEFSVRFPSLIFGVMSIYLIFLLGKKLFNEKVGLLASYLFAVSTFNIYHSQFARLYNMLLFFTLTSFLFFYEALEKNKKLFWSAYAFFTLVSLLLSITALPIILCQLVFMILFWKHYRKYINRRKILLIFTVVLSVYSLSLSLVLFTMPKIDFGKIEPLRYLVTPSLDAILDIFNLFGGKLPKFKAADNIAINNFNVTTFPVSIFGIVLFLLCILGIFSCFKTAVNLSSEDSTKKQVMNGTFLSLWIGLPIFLPYVLSFIIVPLFGPARYVLYTSCAYYILISKGIMHLKKKAQMLVMIFIVFMSSMFLYRYYHVEKRLDWRGICSYITANLRNDEKIAFKVNNFIPISYEEHPALLYYLGGSSYPTIGIRFNNKSDERPSNARYNRILKLIRWEWHNVEDLTFNGIWLVIFRLRDSDEDSVKMLEDKYELVERKFIDNVGIYHFRKRNIS